MQFLNGKGGGGDPHSAMAQLREDLKEVHWDYQWISNRIRKGRQKRPYSSRGTNGKDRHEVKRFTKGSSSQLLTDGVKKVQGGEK